MKTKLLLAISIAVLSALCPAPIKEQPPAGYVPPPMSMSEEELARQQAQQERIDEVGKVPERTENTYLPASQATASAADTLKSATVSSADEVIRKASRDLGAHKSGNSPVWVFVAVMLLFGLGVVFAFRQWAEKNVPMPQPKGKKPMW